MSASSAAPPRPRQVVLVRHGQTEWSRDGRHTGLSDLALTEQGREQARSLGPALAAWRFRTVLQSPLRRASETCRLAGFADPTTSADLVEWDYGQFEGLTTEQIRAAHPGWVLWRDGPSGGESVRQVSARVDRVIATLRNLEGDVAIFSHGHLLRILAARWLAQEASFGARLGLTTSAVCVLGYQGAEQVTAILRWNDASHLHRR